MHKSINRILEAIEFVVDDIPIGNNSEPVVITRRSFAVSVQRVDLDQFMERGQTFSVNLGLFSDINTTENINSNDLSFETRDTQSTGSLSLPNNLFSAISNTGNDSRITHSVFLSDSLFLRRQNNNLKVGSLIISASIVGSTVDDLNPPITLSFLKNPVLSYINFFDDYNIIDNSLDYQWFRPSVLILESIAGR